MEIRCPRCAHPLLLAGDTDGDGESQTLAEITNVQCPNCGSVSIESELAQTKTLQVLPDDKNKRIGHFALTKMLGKGAFGVVWLARDVTLGRNVALKLPATDDPEAIDLLREAQTAASLRHPNIVSIYEVGHADGRRYIASEFIDGLTLRDFLSVGRPGIPRAVDLLRDVAEALHHAHEHKVIHRDVKPANILLSKQGQPYIADFGIAKRISSDATISTDGQVIGTAKYMSPEQADGKSNETDRRSDVYALGVILFEMLTGETPFRGNVRALLHQKVHDEAPSPRKFDPSIPKDLETICLKCIEREPGKRYQTASAVAEELNRFRAGEPIQARPISKLERFWRKCRQRPVIASLILGLFLSLTIGLLGVSYFWLDAKNSADRTLQALYRSQMNLAANYLDSGDISGVRRALGRFANGKPGSTFRGFEWYYFDNVTASIVEVVNQGDVVEDIAVSRNGTHCAACGKDKPMRIWEVSTGRLIRTFPTIRGRLRSLDFSPVRDQIAVGTHDGKVRIWNTLQDDKEIREIPHGPPVALVRYSSDGSRILSAGKSGAIRVWNSDDGSLLVEIPAGPQGMSDARLSRDGSHVLVASADKVIRLWEVSGRRMVNRFSPSPEAAIEAIALSDDGQTFAVGCYSGEIHIWSVASQTRQRTYQINARVGGVEFLKDSHVLAIAASDGNVHFYDVDIHREVNKISTHNLSPGLISRSANGKLLAVGSGDGSVKLIRLDDLRDPAVLWHAADVRQVEFLPSGNELVVAAADGSLTNWDLGTQKSQQLVAPTDHPLLSMAIHPDGKWLTVGGPNAPLQLWELDPIRRSESFRDSDAGVAALSFSPTGRHLAAALQQGEILLYESGHWRSPRLSLKKQDSSANEVLFSPDERSVVVAYVIGAVRFFDTSTGALQTQTVQVNTSPTALCYCDRGRLLAVGTDSGEIHLYSPAADRVVEVLKGHSGRIASLATIPNSSTLISAGRDADVRLWDASTGEPITTLLGHVRQVFCVAVSPRGDTIASGGLLGDVRLWRTNPR